MVHEGKYILVSLRYTGNILDELLKRAENFKIDGDRVEFMINQAYRYFPVYDINVIAANNEKTNISIEESIKVHFS